jgi:AraC-like DNA-binding protein
MQECNLRTSVPSAAEVHRPLEFDVPQLQSPAQHSHLATRNRRSPARDHSTVDIQIAPEPFDAVSPILNEDLAQLRPILDCLRLTAGCRLEGETAIRLLHAPPTSHRQGNVTHIRRLDQEVPLYRPCGRRYGSLGILAGRDATSDGAKVVLEALLSLAARSIAERWFRLHHSKAWILAAAPVADRSDSLLLALDQRLKLQGVDFRAARFPRSGATATQPPRWEDFFLPILPLPSLRARGDIRLQLRGTRNGEPWTALLTPPDHCGSDTWTDDTLLYARPRCHALTGPLTIDDLLTQQPSLTRATREKMEEYIEAHLETPLPVESLAKVAGMSCSHFTRAFRNAVKMPPHKYVMWRRLLRAQDLIKNSNEGLADIALATGFADQSHLSRYFHLTLGESPSQFRRRHR